MKTKEPESAQAGPNETRLAGAPKPPGDLLREPVSRDWPLVYIECPEAGDRQETADLAALKTPEGVVSLPAPLHFWAEETERSARWRLLHPGTLAGLADRSPEGTEERRAPCDVVYTALSQRGQPSNPWSIGIRMFWPKTIGPQIRLRPGSATLTQTRNLASTKSDIPQIRSWNTIGAAPPSSPC